MKKNKLIKAMAVTVSTASILQIGEVCTNSLSGITAYATTVASTQKTLFTNTSADKSEKCQQFKFKSANVTTDAQATLVNNVTLNSDVCTTVAKMNTELSKDAYTSVQINIAAVNNDDVQKGCTMVSQTVGCKYTVSANASNSKKADITLTTVADANVNKSFVFKKTIDLTDVTVKSVSISGTERVGKTLSAVVKDTNGNKITSGLTYEWYRLKKKSDDISDGTRIDTDDEHKLTSSDKDKYIMLIVKYNGVEVGYDKTGSIDKKSSSSSSSHDDDDDDSSSSSSSKSSNSTSNNSSSSTTTVAAGSTAAVKQNVNGTQTLVNSNGQVLKGWQKVNGQWYLADNNGNVKTGWQMSNGKWYLLKNTGIMATGWQYTNGNWYLLNNDGAMVTGWKMLGGNWYLLKSDGAMATGWQLSGGKWYYLYADGAMAVNTTIGGYRVNASGAWVK